MLMTVALRLQDGRLYIVSILGAQSVWCELGLVRNEARKDLEKTHIGEL